MKNQKLALGYGIASPHWIKMENPIENHRSWFVVLVQFKVITMIVALILVLLSRCQPDSKVIPAVLPSTIQFTNDNVNLEEGGHSAIAISFSKPAPMDVSLRISISGNAIYGNDYSTTPAMKDGFLWLEIVKGQSMAYLNVIKDDNAQVDGEKQAIFTLDNMEDYGSKAIKLGTKRTMTLMIEDDESAPIANFEMNSARIDENDPNGIFVEISLSHKAPSAGTLMVEFYDGIYGQDFTTLPAAESNKIKLDVRQDETKVSFKILPVDNSIFEGNKSFPFLLSSSETIKAGTEPIFNLTIINDEISHVSFTDSTGTVREDHAEGIRVKINFSRPIPNEANITVLVGEPDWDRIKNPFLTTSPEYSLSLKGDYENGFYKQLVLPLTVPQQASSVEFTIKPINDSAKGNQTCVFYLQSSLPYLITSGEYTLTVLDDD